MAVCWW